MTGISVVASGMVTPVGFNAPASCAAMRGRIRNVGESVLWDSRAGQPVAAGKVPLPQWWTGLGKLADLVAPAIHECLEAGGLKPAQVPIIVGVCSPDRPYRIPGFEEQILRAIEEKLGGRLHPKSGVVARDRVSVAVGLLHAQRLIDTREVSACVVAAVDSLLDGDLVEHFMLRRRVLTSTNSNGFSPGEAGSAILVAPTGGGADVQILGIGLAREPATVDSEEPLRAIGLIEAIRSALTASGLRIEDADYRITDLNGEHYKFKEMVLAMMRYERKARRHLFDLWHPIEYIGDVGTAIGPLALGVGLHAGRHDYGVGPTVLYTFGNDDGERAAVIGRFNPAGPRH